MADITKNSFSEASRHTKVIFQRGRFALDFEVNELADILRVSAAQGLLLSCKDGVTTGFGITPGTNQVTIGPGECVINGMYLQFASSTVISGLTTPGGGSRTDYVYLQLSETEIPDPSPDSSLGVQSYRRKVTATFHVIENGTVPASTGNLWDGGIQRFSLYQLIRPNGDSNVANATITATFSLLPGRILSEITNVVNGKVERLYSGTSSLVSTSQPSESLGFHDTIMSTRTRVNLTDATGDVDSSIAGQNLLAPGVDPSNPVSIIRMINGRGMCSIGNGVDSFGDLNGANALATLCSTFWTAHPGKPLTVFVKFGGHTVNTVITVLGPLHLIGEGGSSRSAPPSITGSAGPVLHVNATYWPVTIEGLHMITSNSDSRVVRMSGSGNASSNQFTARNSRFSGCIYIENCLAEPNTDGTSVLLENCFLEPSTTVNPKSPLWIGGNGVTTSSLGRIVLRGCHVSALASNGTVQKTIACITIEAISANSLVVQSVIIDQCRFVCAENTNNSVPRTPTGVLQLNDAAESILVQSVVFRDCFFTNSGTQGGPIFHNYFGRVYGGTGLTRISCIRNLKFSNCEFKQSVTCDYGAFFWINVRDYGGGGGAQDDTTGVIFDGCTWNFAGRMIGGEEEENTGGGVGDITAVRVSANRIVFRDTLIRQPQSALINNANGIAGFSSTFILTGISKEDAQGYHEAQVVLENTTTENIDESGGGAQPSYYFTVRSMNSRGSCTVRGFVLNQVYASVIGVCSSHPIFISSTSKFDVVTVENVSLHGPNNASKVGGSISASGICTRINNIYCFGVPGIVVGSSSTDSITHVQNCYMFGYTGAANVGISAYGGSTNFGCVTISCCYVHGFAAEGIRYYGGVVSLVGNHLRANNADGVQVTGGSATTVAMFGNRFETSAVAKAGADFTPGAAAPVAGTHHGADTTGFGVFTNGAALHFNWGNLVH